MMMTRSNRQVMLSILILATCFVYYPGLSGGFLFDDFWNILDNPLINAGELSFSTALEAAMSGGSGALGRPLPMLSFYLNSQAGGFDPFGYKLVNVAIHIANALLVFFIIRLLFITQGKGNYSEYLEKNADFPAFIISLLWAVHPINLTSVLYIVQRMNSMSALFVLLGIWVYIRIRQQTFIKGLSFFAGLTVVFFSGVLAALCKENGLLLFVYVLVLEFVIFRWKVSSLINRRILISFYVLSVILPMVLISLFYVDNITAAYQVRSYGITERLMTQSRIIWQYIYQILLPQAGLFGIYHDDISISTGLLKPATTLFSLVGLGALFIASVMFRKAAPLFSLGVLWFFCGHSMESTVIALEMVHEHRNYLPSIGLLIIFFSATEGLKRKEHVLASNLLLCGMLLLFVVLTFQRAHDWRDPLILAETTAVHHPNSMRANYDAAYMYIKLYEITRELEYLDKGVNGFRNAMKVDERTSLPHLSLLIVDSSFSEANINFDKNFYDDLDFLLRNSPVGQPEIKSILTMADCYKKETCEINDRVVIDVFDSFLTNPFLTNGEKDKMSVIFGTYLQNFPGEGHRAVSILEAVVSRHQDNIDYQVALASALVKTGNRDRATSIMDDLGRRFGITYKFDQ